MRASWLALVVLGTVGGIETVFVQRPYFSSQAETVTVDVHASRRGTPVHGLAKDAFVISDNGVRQEIVQFSDVRLPIDLRLVLDTSASMNDRQRTTVRSATDSLIASLEPTDSYTLSGYSQRISVLEPDLLVPVPIARGSSIRDALLLSLVSRQVVGRRTLTVLMTDGDDSSSFFGKSTVLTTARFANTPVCVVLIKGPRRLNAQDQLLRAVVGTTGGQFVEIGSVGELRTALLSIVGDARAGYTLGFSPSDATNGWHALQVRASDPTVSVRSRRGYWRR